MKLSDIGFVPNVYVQASPADTFKLHKANEPSKSIVVQVWFDINNKEPLPNDIVQASPADLLMIHTVNEPPKSVVVLVCY